MTARIKSGAGSFVFYFNLLDATMNKIEDITEENFEEKVLKSNKPVLVDFWAPSCQPCRMFEPVLKEVAQELSEKFEFYKVNGDEELDVMVPYNITGFPTFILFQNGEEILREIGAGKSKQEFIYLLNSALE